MTDTQTPLPHAYEEDEISLLDILVTLAESWKLLAFGPLVVGVLAGGLSFLWPNTYESVSIVRLTEEDAALIHAAPVLDPLIAKFDLLKTREGYFRAYDQATGKFLWQAVHDKLESGQVNDWPKEGVCSTPTVDGDRLYVLTENGDLACLKTDGTAVWRENRDFTAPTSISSTAAISASGICSAPTATRSATTGSRRSIPPPVSVAPKKRSSKSGVMSETST